MADAQNPTTWPLFAEADPEYTEAVAAMGGAPSLDAFSSIQAMREWIEDSKRAAHTSFGSVSGVQEEDRQVTMRDGHQIVVRIYTPEPKTADDSALAVVYHGGGWCVGGLVNEEHICRLMVSTFGTIVVNVDYRLGPEFQFPTAQYDGYDATKWAAENATSLGANPAKGFTIHGTSAGGNIASTVSHLWRDNKMSPPLTGVHLMVPAVCDAASFPEELKRDWRSRTDLIDQPNVILNRAASDLFLSNFIPNTEDRGSQLFSPLLFDHKGLPPHYFQLCGMDPLRDEALIYERLLREQHGIKTKVDVYQGVPHGFWTMFPQLSASKTFVQDSIAGVKWLLE